MKIVRPINDLTPRITQGYKTTHRAVDYGYVQGTPVYACFTGQIRTAVNMYETNWKSDGKKMEDYGNYIEIQHTDGFTSRYAHLKKDSLLYKAGTKVMTGQKIAEVGNTGNSTGPHLHFELKKNGTPVNPATFMNTKFTNYKILNSDNTMPVIKPSSKLPKEFYEIEESKNAIKRELITNEDAFDTIIGKFVDHDKKLNEQKVHFDEEQEAWKELTDKKVELVETACTTAKENLLMENRDLKLQLEALNKEIKPKTEASKELFRYAFFGLVSYLATEVGINNLLGLVGTHLDTQTKVAIAGFMLGLFRWVDKYLHEKDKEGEGNLFTGLTPQSLVDTVNKL